MTEDGRARQRTGGRDRTIRGRATAARCWRSSTNSASSPGTGVAYGDDPHDAYGEERYARLLAPTSEWYGVALDCPPEAARERLAVPGRECAVSWARDWRRTRERRWIRRPNPHAGRQQSV
ncbi:hypothetical protein C2R22_17650 [Salinigranum rubrum]|uniref:Uncharacterized protein n=1 Tax=Salinigranum rubrum TaxID=755307 RepID=A0A2I8VMT1_9EURY|nr:hypothetical protein [Salinigranum rubrum]AUV83240.1 hypothetical protein C2R22_17650 [Salinigranum rubrum]